MRPWIALALVLGVACRNAGTNTPTEPDDPEQAFAGTVILGRPTASSITASLLAAADQDVFLEYGTQQGQYPQRSSVLHLQAGVPANLTVSGLALDSRYYYRVRIGSAGSSATGLPEHTFHTQRAPGQEYVFDIEADPHDGDGSFDGQVFTTAMERVRADNPDFLVDLGDSFMTEKRSPASYDDVLRITSGLRPYWAAAAADVPLLLALGNHDGEQGWELTGSESLAAWAVRARQRYYPNPVPGSFYSGSSTTEPVIGIRDGYYAWSWGDALFVVLDPYWYTLANPGRDFWSFSLGEEQYRWLARTLRQSTARYKFVFAHQLLTGILGAPRGGVEAAGFYEWGGKNGDGSWGFAARRPGWEQPIHQLLVETGVTAVFHGHDHFFARQELDGIVYQMVPQPSYARTTEQYSAAEYGYLSGVMFGSSGYLRIRVSPARALVEYVKVYPAGLSDGRKTGDVAYSYALSPRG